MTDEAMSELEALLQYLVKHNEDHAGEIMDLAARAETLGKTGVHEHLLRGVDLLSRSNESLRAALAELRS